MIHFGILYSIRHKIYLRENREFSVVHFTYVQDITVPLGSFPENGRVP